MAVVFLGHDLRHERDVAIKVLLPELAASVSPERFTREIRIAARLQHPMILPLFDSGEVDGLLYYVMPYVEGESLRDRIEREGPLPLSDALQIGREVAEALGHAHERGVVHRDIKPDNILLSGGHPLLADFGVARAVSMDETNNLTGTGLLLGSPRYMSPEQTAGSAQIDERSDIYALGCVVYEMLAGAPPFDSDSLPGLLIQHMENAPPDISAVREDVSGALRNTIETALAKDPNDRFQTAGAFSDALRAPETVTVRAPTLRVRRPGPRSIAAAAAVIAALGVTAWLASRDWGPPEYDADLIAIAPFDATDPALVSWSEGVLDNLASGLNGAGPLRTVAPTEVMQRWRGRADQASARRLANRTGAGISVFGSVLRSGGDRVRLTASVVDVAEDRIAGEVSLEADENRLPLAVDSLTVRLLRTLDLVRPLGMVQLESFRSAPLPAIKAYLRGEHYFRRTAWDSAGVHFERAAELDSTFTLALRRIYQVRYLKGSGQDSLIWDAGIRAGRLVEGLGVRETLLVTADSVSASIRHDANAADDVLQTRRQRVLRILDEATRRFPDDAEVWFQLGLARARVGWAMGETPDRVLDAYDRAIAIDSTFGPALLEALSEVVLVRGEDAMPRYFEAFLALDPIGLHGDAARLAAGLMDPSIPGASDVERTLDTASALLLYQATSPIAWWPDPNHTAIRLLRILAERPHDPRVSARPQLVQNSLMMALAWRGRLEESFRQTRGQPPLFLSQLALLGGVPPEAASDSFARWLRPEGTRPHVNALFALPWWAERDTTALRSVIAGIDADPAEPGSQTEADFRYLRASAEAYLGLARGDSSTALQRFLNLPAVPERFKVAGGGEWDEYQMIRLLNARERFAEAAEHLARIPRVSYFAVDILLMLERARAAEALGNREEALLAYGTVARAWVDADEPLQPIVAEAHEATARLLESPGS